MISVLHLLQELYPKEKHILVQDTLYLYICFLLVRSPNSLCVMSVKHKASLFLSHSWASESKENASLCQRRLCVIC